MTRTCQDAVGGELVHALEMCWSQIRARHSDLPCAVIITGAGTLAGAPGVRLGHFAASRWQTTGEVALAEVFVGGEGLARGARDVLATLLHEAAHSLAHQRGISDTSRQGRYHNQRFKALAVELGLHVEHHPTLGWSPTTLPAATAGRYARAITELEAALTAYRASEPARPSRPSSTVACVCSCGRRIRIAPSVLAVGPVICGVCAEVFVPPTSGG